MLTPTQQDTLRAAIDRVIPADDYPSGWEAGVGDFLALLFRREPRFLPVYQSGLDGIDLEAQTALHAPFAALTAEQQDNLLARLEAGEAQTSWPGDAAAFFALLVEQAMEGFYADPGNGGNKAGISWDMIGYSPKD